MGKQWNQWQTLFSWAPESLQMVTATMKLKTLAPWKKTYDQPRQCIKKQRQGEAVRNNSATLGQGPGSTSKDTHNIFELFQRTKIPNKHINYLMRHSSFQRGHSLITSGTTEAHQETTWGPAHTLTLISNATLQHCHKTPHQIHLGWDTKFWGQ